MAAAEHAGGRSGASSSLDTSAGKIGRVAGYLAMVVAGGLIGLPLAWPI